MKKSREIGIWLVIAMLFAVLFTMPTALAADVVLVTAPDGGQYWKTSTENITWTQETTDATNDTFHVGYYTTGSTTWINTSLVAGSTYLIWDTTGVPDATNYKINVTKVNTNVGNTSDTSNATFTIDDTAPVVAITMTSSGIRGSYVDTVSSTLTFSGTMTDATSGNKNITVGVTAGAITTNTWTATSVSISDGCNAVTAIGYDEAGNSHSVSKTVCKSTDGTGSSFVPPPSAAAPSYQIPSTLSILTGEDGEITGGHVVLGVMIVLLLVVIWKWWK